MMFFAAVVLNLFISFASGHISGPPFKDTLFAPKRKLGGGFMRTYVKFDAETSNPKEYGLRLDAALVETLTDYYEDPSDGTYDIPDENGDVVWYCCGYETKLTTFGKMPSTVFGSRYNLDGIPFSHFVSNYNPQGHAPDRIYNVPHFDFHWYILCEKDRKSIEAPEIWGVDTCGEVPVTCDDLDILMKQIPSDTKPPNHCTPAPGATVEPAMGNHLIDLANSPEFAGAGFTHTWIFGVQDGRVSFWEPMITTEYLISLKGSGRESDPTGGVMETPNKMSKLIAIPEKSPVAGYFPTKYTIEYDSEDDVYIVALTDLVFLSESDSTETVSVIC